MPVKAAALKAEFVVDPRLVNVDLAAKQLPDHAEDARVASQPVKAPGNLVHAEHRPDGAAGGIRNDLAGAFQLLAVLDDVQLFKERLHPLLREEAFEPEKAVALVA